MYRNASKRLKKKQKTMEEDGCLTPGAAAFWNHFYDEEEGRLTAKELLHRKAEEVKSGGSLLDHYEWFCEFSLYGHNVVEFLDDEIKSPARERKNFRVLHVGCGNSNFCADLSSALQFSSAFSHKNVIVLNTDICEAIIQRLSAKYPERLYATGNCCKMFGLRSCTKSSSSEDQPHVEWYRKEPLEDSPLIVYDDVVQMIFDKGTLDALLSSFPGLYNPNAQAYAEEAIRILEPGGGWFLISINSPDTVDSYVLCVSYEKKSFRRIFQREIQLSSTDQNLIRVETLGSRYMCYGYLAVTE